MQLTASYVRRIRHEQSKKEKTVSRHRDLEERPRLSGSHMRVASSALTVLADGSLAQVDLTDSAVRVNPTDATTQDNITDSAPVSDRHS